MGLIPKAVKNLFSRRGVQERNGMTMTTTSEAKRWDDARKDADVEATRAVMKKAGFEKLSKKDLVMLTAAREMFTTGKLTPEVKLAAEAVAPQLFTMTTGDGEDPGFRRITSLATLRDLNPLMHDRMLQVCYFLAVTTPFGKRIVEILSDYTMGKGVRVTAKDERVQAVIDDFWDDEVNDMDANVESWCDEQTIFGELCIPVAVNPVSGKVRVGYIDPMNIDTIQSAEMATADGTASINVPFAVKLRREVGEVLQKPMLIVRRVEDPNDENYGRLDGECFYFALNKAKSASRGFSELFSLADWIDLFDQMIFDFGDKVRFLNSFVWHYVIDGADGKKVQEFKDQLTKDPPKQGGALFTNGHLLPGLEIGHHPWRKKGMTYEDYLGRRGLDKYGKARWNDFLEAAIAQTEALFNWDHLYLGGGNTKKILFTPANNVSIVSNESGLLGGVALWRDQG